MARKNIDFTARLEKIIKESGLENQEFAKIAKINYTTLMNYIVPGSRGRVPEWDILVKISEHSNISIDWLLTGNVPFEENVLPAPFEFGKSTEKPHRCEFCGDMSDENKKLCKKVKEVMDSEETQIADALKANIDAFHGILERERKHSEEIESLKKIIMHHEKLLDPDRFTGTGKEAGTGKKKKKI